MGLLHLTETESDKEMKRFDFYTCRDAEKDRNRSNQKRAQFLDGGIRSQSSIGGSFINGNPHVIKK